ncbi:hypothetical protein [Myroides sp.]|uniref:hypothetical protein n=1 Tax=Myroides sp. TaxID=1874736 RepID=UPI0028B19567|nr:hypothetical protein [Myroides sp.]
MTLELFEELSDVLGVFVEKFTNLNIKTNKHSLAWQRFHYNYFDSMTTTLYKSLVHLNYATIQQEKDNVQYAEAFSLVLDKNFKQVRDINFDKFEPKVQQQILKVVLGDLPFLTKGLNEDTYHYIKFNCLNRENRLCGLGGTLFKDSKTGELILNLFYLNIRNERIDSLLEVDFYMKDKAKYIKLYRELALSKVTTPQALKEVLDKKNISSVDFNNDFIYFFGEGYLTFYDKRKYLQSLELVFFTKNSFEEIADVCGFNSTESLITKYKKFESNGYNPIIRYSNILQA